MQQAHRDQAMQGPEGQGEDCELYPKRNGKALSDSEQKSVPTGVGELSEGREKAQGHS